jgi:hypothetical protein
MSHARLVVTYSIFMFGTAAGLGGFVACGAPSYRVPVHGEGEDPQGSTEQDSGKSKYAGTSGDKKMNAQGTSLLGVHSQEGWSKSGPIQFYTSSEASDKFVAQLRAAIKTWEKSVGKQLFIYQGVESKAGRDFSALYEPLNDKINGHYLDFTWLSSTGKSAGVLATTIWENDPNDAQSIVKADIRYNAQYYVFGDALSEYSQGQRTVVDLESLALHELGHLLGLSHITPEDDKYSVMNPSLFIGEGMATRKLSRGDVERIRSIYGVGNPDDLKELEIADESASQDKN